MVGRTFAAIDRASTTQLDLQGEQQQGKQALPWELTLICLATRGKQTRQTSGNKCTKHALSLFGFFETDTEKYNMVESQGEEILDSSTYKPTTVMETKYSDTTRNDKTR
jgi:hypothetical protein